MAMKKKRRIKVTIVLEVDARDANDAFDALDRALDVGLPQEILLGKLADEGLRFGESVSALVDFD